ncbi:MAG TPA: hypothetical protein VMF91_06820 [Bryobacteraceae bacterium]|nr:hypothetical protein [Bryobacteraceae bacterium]
MNTISIHKTEDGYEITYITGLGVKVSHELMEARDEAELAEVLKGEGVPKTITDTALADLRHNGKSTTVRFQRKP